MAIPSPIYLYRIIHIDNLPYIIRRSEITSPSNVNADPDYIVIGDDSLKEHRKDMPINLPPYGTVKDYIAFYFGMRSPMLFNIQYGNVGVTRRSQDEIIYMVTSFEKVKEMGVPYVFYDGHGYHHLSQLFNSEEGLSHVDWNTVNATKWNDTEEDPDRKRRKQAEFLLFRALPLDAIIAFATYSDSSKKQVENIVNNAHTSIATIVKPEWFY